MEQEIRNRIKELKTFNRNPEKERFFRKVVDARANYELIYQEIIDYLKYEKNIEWNVYGYDNDDDFEAWAGRNLSGKEKDRLNMYTMYKKLYETNLKSIKLFGGQDAMDYFLAWMLETDPDWIDIYNWDDCLEWS